MNSPIVVAADAVVLSRRPDLRALTTLFVLTLRQYVRGRRLLVLSLLFALPSVLAAVVGLTSGHAPAAAMEFAFVFNLIPHAIAPLAALLYAAGVIQDDVEDQTLTYLLLRPLPRWALYLVKLLATLLVTSALTAVFTTIAFTTIALTASEPATAGLIGRELKMAGLLALAQVAYCGVFGFLGLLTRHSFLAGVAYIIVLEGFLASFQTVARRLTVMYYFRVLVLRWLEPATGAKEWAIDLATAPKAQTCVLTLLGVGLVSAIAAAIFFAASEFRMKTPEGN
jgi:ABC-2 type transport system permease protein